MPSEAKSWMDEHGNQLRAAFLVIAVIVLLIGLCFSWFVHNESLSTVGAVKEPSPIMLRGPNATEMAQIDLTYDPENDVTEENGVKKVTVKRAFCVKSTMQNTDYDLYLSRTTNIAGMDVKLYRANALDTTSEAAKTADVKGLDAANNPFAWNKVDGNLISGNNFSADRGEGYLNKQAGAMLADPSSSSKTFGDYTNIQINASSVYWKKTGLNTGETSVNNYIIEVTWTETQKETDVLYLIANAGSAQNAQGN